MTKPRGILIAGNWKMNLGIRDTHGFLSELKERLPFILDSKDQKNIQQGKLKIFIIPSFMSLEPACSHLSSISFPLTLCAQNAQGELKGAYTGEISGPMLQEIGIQWVLLGHSERRHLFRESDADIRKKAEGLLLQGFKVILCIGETRLERENGKTAEVLVRQLTESMPHLKPESFLQGQLILAYEPVWAIGTGLTASPEQAEEAHQIIRSHLQKVYGLESANQTSILYGGSVTPKNIHSILSCSHVDGALVGGASLKVDDFLALLLAGGRMV